MNGSASFMHGTSTSDKRIPSEVGKENRVQFPNNPWGPDSNKTHPCAKTKAHFPPIIAMQYIKYIKKLFKTRGLVATVKQSLASQALSNVLS